MSYITYQVEVYADGSKHWYLNDKLHRTDGPAIEDHNGERRWYLNGELHRTDGPAVEYADGTKEWYLNGECHRTDGPAVEYPNGIKSWRINGKEYSEAEFHEKMNPNDCNGKIVEIDGVKYQLKSVE